MSEKSEAQGTVAWQDLTVPDAERVRDFYSQVLGWRSEPVDMGGYSDFNMIAPATGETVAGICHARGGNAALPAQWLLYFLVEDLETSTTRCVEAGGAIVARCQSEPGSGGYCVIRDPAGAVCALYQKPPD